MRAKGNILRQFSLRDLVCYALYRIRSAVDLFVSTGAFQLKCALLGVELGPRPSVWGRVVIHRFPGSQIRIGSNARIVSRVYRYAYNIFPQSKLRTFLPSAKILIGDNVGFNSASIVARSQTIEIGDNTLIGGNCHIMDSDGHPLWPPDQRQHYPGDEHDRPVVIGKNVFIGMNVIILKGVTIGDNSIVAAGSVVSRSIPADCVAAGVPARVVRQMTPKEAAVQR